MPLGSKFRECESAHGRAMIDVMQDGRPADVVKCRGSASFRGPGT